MEDNIFGFSFSFRQSLLSAKNILTKSILIC